MEEWKDKEKIRKRNAVIIQNKGGGKGKRKRLQQRCVEDKWYSWKTKKEKSMWIKIQDTWN